MGWQRCPEPHELKTLLWRAPHQILTVVGEARFAQTHYKVHFHLIRSHRLGTNGALETCKRGEQYETLPPSQAHPQPTQRPQDSYGQGVQGQRGGLQSRQTLDPIPPSFLLLFYHNLPTPTVPPVRSLPGPLANLIPRPRAGLSFIFL